MKHAFYISLVGVCALIFSACGKIELEHSENGKLDGNWHLVTVDSLDNGRKADFSKDYIFWQVQGTLFQAFDATNTNIKYVFRLEYSDNRVRIGNARLNDRVKDDPVVEDVAILQPLGINALQEDFIVERLTGKHLTLKGHYLRLSFRRM